MSGGLHLRGQAVALHPPGRVRRLRRVRAGVPGRGHLLRGRRPHGVERLLPRERRVLRRPRLARRCREDGPRREGRPDDRRPPAAGLTARRRTMGLADLSGLAYPWDTLGPYAARARAHERGLVDLSIGTPVDPTPAVVRDALAAASDAHGYPTTHGTPALREAVAAWFARRRGVPGLDPDAVLPTIGSKELVGLLPSLLRLGAGDVVVHPETAYPTYDVGARLAGATPLATDDVEEWAGRDDVRLVWVNSPSNPTGRVLDAAHLARVVAAARETGAVVASDECYAELAWAEPYASQGVPSLLDPT